MKKSLLLTLFVAMFALQAKAQVVHIELDIRNHLNNSSNLTNCVLEPSSANYKMYIHSGVCSATTAGVPDTADCQNPTYVWEHVVGDWGQDNGHGLMTEITDSVWAIDIDVSTFYSDANTISQTGQGSAGASTPMPVGATAYSMGFVFRNEDGSIGGITGGCTDFFIFNLNQGNTTVDIGQPGFPLPDSTFEVSSAPVSVVNQMIDVSFQTIYPNPFNDEVKITYETKKSLDNISFNVYNSMGQKVRELYQGPIQQGVSTLVWDGNTISGQSALPGVYYLQISDGQQQRMELIVKQ